MTNAVQRLAQGDYDELHRLLDDATEATTDAEALVEEELDRYRNEAEASDLSDLLAAARAIDEADTALRTAARRLRTARRRTSRTDELVRQMREAR